jgi:hypothetical protein
MILSRLMLSATCNDKTVKAGVDGALLICIDGGNANSIILMITGVAFYDVEDGVWL